MNLSDFFTSINQSKQNLMAQDPSSERVYVPFVINKSFSYFMDSLFQANYMNKFHNLPKKMQYDYYLYGLSKNKRFSKWIKPEESDNLSIIKEYYGYSDKKAREVLPILSENQIKILKNKLNKGQNS
jgi:hypothetical protein